MLLFFLKLFQLFCCMQFRKILVLIRSEMCDTSAKMFDKAFPSTACSSHTILYVCFVSVIHFVCPFVCMNPLFLTRANFRAGAATFQFSDTVVFVFVFAIPVCLDPCDPVDCGNSVPPCHSEPVWRNDLVSSTQTVQRNTPCCLWLSLHVCRHSCVLTVVVALHTGF